MSILVNKFPLSDGISVIPEKTSFKYIKTSEGYIPYCGRIIYDITCKALGYDFVISCSRDIGDNMNLIRVNNIICDDFLRPLYWKDVFDEKFPLIV